MQGSNKDGALNRDFNFAERITKAETELSYHKVMLEDHETLLRSIVGEVKQIRTAIWFMAAAISANIPVLQSLAGQIKLIFAH